MDRSLISGNTTLLVMRLLTERDMYGYEMIDTLRERSQNIFELKVGTLYPLLHGLEEKKLLSSYEKEVAGKSRKYYSITKSGKKVFEQKKRLGSNTRRQLQKYCYWEVLYDKRKVFTDGERADSL